MSASPSITGTEASVAAFRPDFGPAGKWFRGMAFCFVRNRFRTAWKSAASSCRLGNRKRCLDRKDAFARLPRDDCPSAPAWTRCGREIGIDQARRRTARGRYLALGHRGEDAVHPFALQLAKDMDANGIAGIVGLSPCRGRAKSWRKG